MRPLGIPLDVMRQYFAHVVAKSRATRGSNGSARHAVAKGLTSRKVARGDFSARTIARPTNPHKSNALQRAKTLSSKRIFAPADVLAVEIFDRLWKPAISSNGLPISIAPLRQRTLVGSP